MTSSPVQEAARAACTSLTESRAVFEELSTPKHSYTFLGTIFPNIYTITMDFRSLDRMGGSDEAILEEPYSPFYSIFASKPVLIKQ